MGIRDSLDHGRIHLKTRIVFPPMATHGSENGIPGEKTLEHYRAIAENPLVGLLITEHSYIDVQGKADPNQMSFASDEVIGTQKALTDRIHSLNPDLKLFAQINHAGANTAEAVTGQPLVSAGSIRLRDETSRALSVDEIHELEGKFADAALRVKKSGYDGVEIHSAHAYLLNEFYSLLTNLRRDEYGAQNMENRLRFLTETYRKVREAVGADYPVAVRLGGADYMEGGSTIGDAAEAASMLEKEGIDLIDLSGGLCLYTRKDNRNPGYFSDMSEAVKQKVSIPVLVTGGVKTPEQAEALLQNGKADLIGVGRALYRDASWGAASL